MQAARRAWTEAQPGMDPRKACVYRSNMGFDQHDPELWTLPQRLSMHRFGAARRLANDYLYSCCSLQT